MICHDDALHFGSFCTSECMDDSNDDARLLSCDGGIPAVADNTAHIHIAPKVGGAAWQ